MRGWIASLLFLTLLPGHPSFGQDFGWWNRTHDWDGVSPWRSYLNLAPASLGPNALPVPEIKTGRLGTGATLQLAGDAHFSRGDNTQNLYLEGQLPLFSDRVALNLQYVPIEHYRTDEATRDERASREFDGTGFASGDVYVGTYIQLLRDHPHLPDVLLTINLKTASGNALAAARFTDTPGYFFDVSVGKTYSFDGSENYIRPFAMAGLYVWQTFQDDHYQNDAFLYGVGLEAALGSWVMTHTLGGYVGYLGNGDRPMVYRLGVKSDYPRRLNYVLRVQRGLADFPYTSIRLGGVLRIGGGE